MFLIFNFSNLQWWKLNSTADWLQFLLLAGSSFLVLVIYYRIIVTSRSEAAAVDRVDRRLKRHAEKDARRYKNVGLRIGDQDLVVDNLMVDKHGILLGHTFGRGLQAYGEPDDQFWRIKDSEGSELVHNPLYEVAQMVHPLQTALAAKDVYGANIEGLAVFADNFAEPSLFVGKTPNAIIQKDIKKFCEQRGASKVTIKDPAKVAAALEPFFFEVPLKENYRQRKAREKVERKARRAAKKAAKKK